MASSGPPDWLAVVDDDLRQVTNNLHGPMPSLGGAAYHCQQAAEKLVKAVLVEADITGKDFELYRQAGSSRAARWSRSISAGDPCLST